MLKKVKNQENILFMFFVVILISLGVYIMVERALIDIIYFVIILFYFFRFLIIRRKGK